METVSPTYLRLGMKKKQHLCNQRLSALMVELIQVRVIMPVLFSIHRDYLTKKSLLRKVWNSLFNFKELTSIPTLISL